jgi:hypothetical protein
MCNQAHTTTQKAFDNSRSRSQESYKPPSRHPGSAPLSPALLYAERIWAPKTAAPGKFPIQMLKKNGTLDLKNRSIKQSEEPTHLLGT